MMIQAIIAGIMMLQAPAGAALDTQPVSLVQMQEDPAELLNLGVKFAEEGETQAARLAFEKVRSMRVDYTLETTDGRYVYPADLARQGLAMLDAGAFHASDKIARR